jgi:hypothetical protein
MGYRYLLKHQGWRLFLAIFPLMALWSLANPIFASPDEPAHLVRSQGVVVGRFSGPFATDGIPVADISCLNFQPEATADCMPLAWVKNGPEVHSSADNYPPLYHFVAGLPSLVVSGLFGAHVMRLWSAVVCAALFVFAGLLLYERYPSGFVVTGWVLSITPMVVFLSATVNPSGMTAALCSVIWASVMLLASAKGEEVKKYRIIFCLSILAFLFVRRDSILWIVVILFCYGLLRGNKFLFSLQRVGKRTWAVLAGFLSLALWQWILPVIPEALARENIERNRVTAVFNDTLSYYRGAIGWFGWQDTPLPWGAVIFSVALLGSFLVLGFVTAGRLRKQALFLVTLCMFSIPLIIAELQYPYFQGRYYFPLFVGVFLVAGVALAEAGFSHALEKKVVAVFLFGWGVLQVWGFGVNLLRYSPGDTLAEVAGTPLTWSIVEFTNLIYFILFCISIIFSVFLLFSFSKHQENVRCD